MLKLRLEIMGIIINFSRSQKCKISSKKSYFSSWINIRRQSLLRVTEQELQGLQILKSNKIKLKLKKLIS
jgi:hypothetical protein